MSPIEHNLLPQTRPKAAGLGFELKKAGKRAIMTVNQLPCVFGVGDGENCSKGGCE